MKMPHSVRSTLRSTGVRASLGLWLILCAQSSLIVNAEDITQAENAPTYIAKAQEARRIGRLGPAVQHYYRALYYDPANPEASRELSELLIGQKRYEEAQKILDAALEASPDDPELWVNQGLASEKGGDHGKAQDAYQRAADMARDDPFIQTRAATFYRSRGNKKKADALSQRAQAAEASLNQGKNNDNATE